MARGEREEGAPQSKTKEAVHPAPCFLRRDGCDALSTQAMLSRLALEFPALTEFGVDELLGLAVTAWLESLGIPVESAPGAPGRVG